MPRFLITQSLVNSWAYAFDCREGFEEEAYDDFLRVLRREPGVTNEAMQNGIDFENAVYATAAGRKPYVREEWQRGVDAVANIVRGAQFQVKVSRPITVDGMDFMVYGILDALMAGTIYDVKFKNSSLAKDDVYGKYLDSPQHPFYFHLVPSAREFKYLLSDGDDLYVETYERSQVRPAEKIISDFIKSITGMGLLPLYQLKWVSK